MDQLLHDGLDGVEQIPHQHLVLLLHRFEAGILQTRGDEHMRHVGKRVQRRLALRGIHQIERDVLVVRAADGLRPGRAQNAPCAQSQEVLDQVGSNQAGSAYHQRNLLCHVAILFS